MKLNDLINFIKNIIFPPRCVFCERILEPNIKLCVCGECGADLEFCADSVCCEKCGKPILGFGEKKLCYFCVNKKAKHFNRIISVFTYEGNVKKSIIKYKSQGLESHADVYSDCISMRIVEEYKGLKFDFICGPPSHNERKSGFDQVELLCKRLSKKLEIPYKKGIFAQTRKTKKQSGLSYKARLENMVNSLKITKNTVLDGQTVLLIDDVCTTRSTITECARALKASGAKSVYAATVATVKNNKYGI